jgi:hypothetical protein
MGNFEKQMKLKGYQDCTVKKSTRQSILTTTQILHEIGKYQAK